MKRLIVCKSVQQSANIRFLSPTKYCDARDISQGNAGFTLVEVIAVVLMVGILAAIAIPGWSTFINRQRVSKANDAVLSALQEVQQQAKSKKLKYSVTFRNNNNLPEVVFHPDSETPNTSNASQWKILGDDLALKPGQIWIGSNIGNPNQGGSTVATITNNGTTVKKITFDYNGTLPINATTPLKIVVAAPVGGNPTQASGFKRCVIVETLLGGIRTAKDSECN